MNIDKKKIEKEVRENFRVVYNGYNYKLQEKKKSFFTKKIKWKDVYIEKVAFIGTYKEKVCYEELKHICDILETLVRQESAKRIGYHELKNPCCINENNC